jgi:16S rRNA (cytosine967-C5)-methyltransferase
MINARTLAFQVLLHMEQKVAYPDRLIRSTLARHELLEDRERALLTELVYGVLRRQGWLDWHIDRLSRIRPDKILPPVRILLRLALYQIFFLDRVPPHAAVNEAVKMARATQPRYIWGFVNALLREAIRRGDNWDRPSPEKDPVEYLAVETSHPAWFADRCIRELGFEEARDLCMADNTVAPVVLRVNPLKTTAAEVMKILEQSGIDFEPSPWVPGAVRVSGMRQDLTRMPMFKDGLVQVQDEASQLVSTVVAPRPGERVLDLCAGFGGKSTHLGLIMANAGEIVAVEKHAWKVEELRENAARQGLTVVHPVARDALEVDEGEIGLFDRVLLDAPCSGLGTLRRNPDIKWRLHVKDPYRFSRLQGQLLERASRFVRPSGVMVYATCTLFSEENEDVVSGFVQAHADWEFESVEQFLPENCRALVQGTFLRSWPHRHGIDGFFIARLRRSR